MPSRKRSIEALDGHSEEAGPQLLHRIRNMWQFANLCQWIYIFGKAAKIDDSIDIEQIETECLRPNSDILTDVALALLKLVSSHRGLTHDIFDDQARKQYLARAPDHNPFGDGEEPQKFIEFDVVTKIRVLQQLTQWIMVHPERIRDKMEEQKDIDQTSWRIEPYGWDSQDRTYYVLDDNRVYRLTEAPTPPPRSKKSKSSRSGRRSSKRRRTTLGTDDEQPDVTEEEGGKLDTTDDNLGGMIWECVAITLEDVRQFLEGLRKTRDQNEKILRKQLEDYLLPILEKQEESRKRKELQRERELLNLAKMANAKRSGRIAGKMEQQKREQEEKEEELRHREDEAAKRREEQLRLKTEMERDTRLISREKRLMEREARRVQHEEELASLSEDSRNVEPGVARLSERRLQAEIERNKQALLELEQEEEDWVFDCKCGLHGHVDDGTHSVACERCNVWQHSKCLGVSEEEADRPDFQFVCTPCVRREEEVRARSRPAIKLKVNNPSGPALAPPHEPPSGPREASFLVAGIPPQHGARAEHFAHQGPSHGAGTVRDLGEAQQPVSEAFDAKEALAARSVLSGTAQYATAAPDVASEAKHVLDAPVNMRPVLNADQDGSHATEEFSPGQFKSSVTIPARTPTGVKQPHASDHTVETSLSSPHITRDIYRAAHVQNGALPSTAGYSPTKQSPQPPESVDRSKAVGIGHIIPPIALLSPAPREPILTPPTKPSELMRPNGSH